MRKNILTIFWSVVVGFLLAVFLLNFVFRVEPIRAVGIVDRSADYPWGYTVHDASTGEFLVRVMNGNTLEYGYPNVYIGYMPDDGEYVGVDEFFYYFKWQKPESNNWFMVITWCFKQRPVAYVEPIS